MSSVIGDIQTKVKRSAMSIVYLLALFCFLCDNCVHLVLLIGLFNLLSRIIETVSLRLSEYRHHCSSVGCCHDYRVYTWLKNCVEQNVLRVVRCAMSGHVAQNESIHKMLAQWKTAGFHILTSFVTSCSVQKWKSADCSEKLWVRQYKYCSLKGTNIHLI